MADSQHPIPFLSAYYAGELAPANRQAVTEHLEHCASCRHELSLLRQTVEILEEVRFESAPQDFLDKLTRRIEQDKRFRLLEAQRQQAAQGQKGMPPDIQNVSIPSVARLTPSMSPWIVHRLGRFWRRVCFPMRLQLPLYAAVGVAVAVAFLLHSSPQELAPDQNITLVRPQNVTQPPHQKLASVDVREPQPPGASTSPPQPILDIHTPPVPQSPLAQSSQGQDPLLPSSPIAALEGALPMEESVVWRVEGAQPEGMRAQAKVLAQQIPGALIVQEGDGLLVLSLPTPQLPAFEQALRELGQVHTGGSQADPANPTTTLQVRFLFALRSSSLSQ